MIKLDLFDVFTSVNKVRTEEVEYKLDVFNLTGVSYEVKKISDIKLKFVNIELDKIEAYADFNLFLDIPCDRCLESVDVPIEVSTMVILKANNKTEIEDEDDELSYLVNNEFIVDEFVKLCVLMNMPSKVLCRDDCKGLCPVCGNNLNISDCGCDSFVPDPRMARIADIFNANKEV